MHYGFFVEKVLKRLQNYAILGWDGRIQFFFSELRFMLLGYLADSTYFEGCNHNIRSEVTGVIYQTNTFIWMDHQKGMVKKSICPPDHNCTDLVINTCNALGAGYKRNLAL